MTRAHVAPASGPGKTEMIQWLFANSRDLLHVIDHASRLLLVNPALSAFVGVAEAQLIGRELLDFVHPDDVSEVRERLAGRRVDEFAENELRVRRADGEWVWFATRAQRLEGDLHIVNMRDATKSRARAAELAEERRTRIMLSTAAGVGAWVYEPAQGRILWSDELVALIGVAAADLAGPDGWQSLAQPGDLRRFLAQLREAVARGEPGSGLLRIKAGGGWRTLRVHFQPEPRPGGEVAIRGITQDITELVQARDAAREGERRMRVARREAQSNAQRLKLALEVADAGVYELDHVARTFWASPEFERLTGKVGSSYEDAIELRYPGFHPDDLAHVRASFRAMLDGAAPWGQAFEARIVRDDGEERWVRVFHHLKRDRNGRRLKAVGLIHDFDARKRQELALVDAQRVAEAATEAKSAFLANMSHEIRTPLNGIMGVLHLLKHEALSPDGRALLDEALSCGAMLAQLLNDVIDFSKIEAGRLELNPEPVDVGGMVSGVAALLRPLADDKSLRLDVDVDPAVGCVRTDPVRLRQALFNLVGNAVKFTEAGGVTIRCRRAGENLRFEVEDTGVGIPLEAQPRIFERFDQGDASTTRRFGGSGLGLAITQRLAEIMGGAVGFTSTPGAGSTFWLEIAAEAARVEAQAETTAERLLDGLRVLVVEDNATNRLIATKLLEHLGASVETAADGYLGVEAASRGVFDLILMDVQMPGIDGPEAARRVRALGGAAARTPIVALTANVLAHQRQAYLETGMDGVVGKPISPAELLSELARLSGRAETAEPKAPPQAQAG